MTRIRPSLPGNMVVADHPGSSVLVSADPSQSPESQDIMNGPTLQQQVVITNPQGLHLRPAAAFASLAKQFQSHVWVHKDGQRVDGKSVLELMCLVALQGTVLTVEVSGPDATDAITALVELLNTPLVDPDEDQAPPRKG